MGYRQKDNTFLTVQTLSKGQITFYRGHVKLNSRSTTWAILYNKPNRSVGPPKLGSLNLKIQYCTQMKYSCMSIKNMQQNISHFSQICILLIISFYLNRILIFCFNATYIDGSGGLLETLYTLSFAYFYHTCDFLQFEYTIFYVGTKSPILNIIFVFQGSFLRSLKLIFFFCQYLP